jgi:VWFA-related protein
MTRTLACSIAVLCIAGGSRPAGHAWLSSDQRATTPQRPSESRFQSEPGTPHPLQIAFDPQTRLVTVALSVEDPDGYFIPNLRPDNFAVYEDGVLQRNATVDVEHAAVTLSVLIEGGGRYLELNKFLTTELPAVTRPLLDTLIPDDKLALLSYASTVRTLADFDQPRERLESVLNQLRISGFSEANLYDALIDVLNRTGSTSGRRALLLLSTGLDTFSHAKFDDVVASAERSDTPVYCIGLSKFARRTLVGSTGPLSKIDWTRANHQLATLATVSHGRAYLRDSELDIPAVYDDLMEHLRVRYVIKYISSNASGSGPMRRVRAALVDPRTGGPLRLTSPAGKAITAHVSGEATYAP